MRLYVVVTEACECEPRAAQGGREGFKAEASELSLGGSLGALQCPVPGWGHSHLLGCDCFLSVCPAGQAPGVVLSALHVEMHSPQQVRQGLMLVHF